MPANPAKTAFGELCARLIDESGRTLREVAAKVPNLPFQQFSKWRAGNWTYIPKLEPVLKAVAPDDHRARCDLVIAYLTDLTPLQYRPTIIIGQKGENEVGGLRPMAGAGSNWSDEMRIRLDAVAEAYKVNDDFATMVDTMTAWAKRINKESAQATAKRP